MKILKNNNLIPIIIIIFCFLIFFGIIHKKKVEKINNIMESFMNTNENIENFENNKQNVVSEIFTDFPIDYINGYWTTPNTKLDSNNKEALDDLSNTSFGDVGSPTIIFPHASDENSIKNLLL